MNFVFSSGGPLMDIIETSEGSKTGYLAVRPTEYADCIANILYNTDEQNETIRNAARFVFMRYFQCFEFTIYSNYIDFL